VVVATMAIYEAEAKPFGAPIVIPFGHGEIMMNSLNLVLSTPKRTRTCRGAGETNAQTTPTATKAAERRALTLKKFAKVLPAPRH